MNIKKIVTVLLTTIIGFSLFAQTKVTADKLAKTLETNKSLDTEFSCELNVSDLVVNGNSLTIKSVTSKKVSYVLEVETEVLAERIKASKKSSVTLTFKAKDLKTKVYAVTKIDGIETVKAYKDRLAEEARIKAEQERLANLTKLPVQVVIQESVNLDSKDASWLPGQIQDKLKSNLQDYVGMRTVVDAKSEKALLQLQKQSESISHDENNAIEFGKITTAKFALFTKLRKTNSGYVISVDFTDLTTGEQMASATSKEYSKTEYLYGTTGAIDELTVAIADKLKIQISEVTRNLLTTGAADFSVDAQMALAKQNEEAYRRQQNNLDEEIKKLSTSTDLASVENKKKLEAQKALLLEKQNTEKKRQEELRKQKEQADADAKLEAERSIALKTQRDQMAKDAAEKAAEVRKLKMEKQGVLGQINVIESKKKALVEIRQSVEERSLELYDQLVKDRESEENRIRNKSYSTVEMENGVPTEQAKKRRENQIVKSNEDLTNKFFADCEMVKQSTMSQQNALLAEICSDQKALTITRTVSSMGDELKVHFGTYAGSQNGWNAYLSLYSDGVLLYSDSFIVNYEALSGKKAPDMATEMDDAVIEEYTNNVDMYNSLLTRGDPIIYFEIDYSVTAESEDKPGLYEFNFSKIRVINTVSGKVTQTSSLNKVQPRTMKPVWDLRKFAGIVEKEKASFAPEKYTIEVCMVNGFDFNSANKLISMGIKIENIPNSYYKILNTEVTQKLYTSIMGSNPSYNKGDSLPVENVSWFDAIYFCNRLSEKIGLIPVYSVDGNTDVNKWNYIPHKGNSFRNEVKQNVNANGFRLPTNDEWEYAARGGQNYTYSGSNNLDEVGWYYYNSSMSQPVAQKKANGYGLYDMSGNVDEWVWGSNYNDRCCRGGSFISSNTSCGVGYKTCLAINLGDRDRGLGFRIVCTTSK